MLPAMSACLFCRIVAGEVPARRVHEDDRVLAFHDISPKAPTHVLVIPRRHIASLDELVPADVELVGHLMVTAAAVARQAGIAGTGYRAVINTGADGGQSVGHVHVHVLGGRPLSWPPG